MGQSVNDSCPATKNVSTNQWILRIALALGATTGIYVGVICWVSRGHIESVLSRISLWLFLEVMCLVCMGWTVRFFRWQYFVHILKWKVPWGDSLIAFVASFAFSLTPGKAGEIVKSVLLRTKHDVSLSQGGGILIVERIGDLLAIFLLALGGLKLLDTGREYFLFFATCILFFAVVLSQRFLSKRICSRLHHFKRLTYFVTKIQEMLESCGTLLRPQIFFPSLLFALCAWSAEALAFHCMLGVFGLSPHLFISASIFGVATFVGALSALPGGLGSFEAVAILLLANLGLSVASATLLVVFFRLCTIWFGSAVGLVALLLWHSILARGQKGPTKGATPVALVYNESKDSCSTEPADGKFFSYFKQS
jgi:glycosyltransferase 2 family protein